ncbi:TPA: hypothetical protein KKX58_001662 [Legionella pneumophila]|nr:hypothetical protein [Legionella pneumophila]HBD7410341.1 hypothetical protein [Legionella pneumophila]HBD9405534.1 hypothetical protein [Legionella pneumophila]HBI2968763.1 hypothetical protein [Legionella pneumophila]
MEKNSKGQILICSSSELLPYQIKSLNRTSAGIGALVVLVYLWILFLFDGFPETNQSLFFYAHGWILILGFGFFAFLQAAEFAFYMKLADMGYALSRRRQSSDYYPSSQQSFSSSNGSGHSFSSTYEASTSINPGSGLPMVGSSGIDTSGNPYGTRSW